MIPSIDLSSFANITYSLATYIALPRRLLILVVIVRLDQRGEPGIDEEIGGVRQAVMIAVAV